MQIANFINSNGNSNSNNNGEGENTEKSEVEKARDSGNFFEKDTTIKDDLENEVRVPEGFKIAEDSATKVEDGVVIENDIGNQFVWIPAKTGEGATIHTTLGDKTIVYQRTDWNSQVGDYSDYEDYTGMLNIMSVNTNGGYYIGRFEAGDKVSTEAKKMRVEGDSQTNEVSIKKGQTPYNYIGRDKCSNIAYEMAEKRGYTGTTRLISSYAWDTAINFIQIKIPDYGINSPQGNYKNITFNYASVGENEKNQTKEYGESKLVPTGQTISVCNIYDMSGNCAEATTEEYYDPGAPVQVWSYRGGDYNYNSLCSGNRITFGSNIDDISSSNSFRVVLFCSNES